LEEEVKRKSIGPALFRVLVLLVLLVAGCTGAKKGIEGTWVYTTHGQTDTIAITPSAWSENNTTAGTLDCTINNIDTGASHILMTVTSSSGYYFSLYGYVAGTVLYVTYSLNGDSLLLDKIAGTYPASATVGPYIRQ
jgi:hypothetical protein